MAPPPPSAAHGSSGNQRRGEELRRHILFVAKDLFLEVGYERASMDAVAARAASSKRSLYAHFESKAKLFLAVLDLVRELYLGQLKTPEAYADAPEEAVTRFCGRFLQLMVWKPQVRTCRLIIAEAERLPSSAHAYYDAMFASTNTRLGAYLADRYALSEAGAASLAERLLAHTVLPRLIGTLLGIEDGIDGHDLPASADLQHDVDLDAIRQLVVVTLPE